MADTAATVNMTAPNNATWQDGFTFTDPNATGWDFTGQKFSMEIKGSPNDTTFLLQLRSDDGEIIIDSVSQRVLHLNVTDVALRAALKVGTYFYDFVMYNTATPSVRTVLMQGTVEVTQGITGD